MTFSRWALRAAATERWALVALRSAATRTASACSVLLCSVEVLDVTPSTAKVSVSALAVPPDTEAARAPVDSTAAATPEASTGRPSAVRAA